MKTVLITKDMHWGNILMERLDEYGLEIRVLEGTAKEVFAECRRCKADVLLVDLESLSWSANHMISMVKEILPLVEIITFYSSLHVDSGVNAIRSGVFDHLSKAINTEILIIKVFAAYKRKIKNTERLEFLQSKGKDFVGNAKE